MARLEAERDMLGATWLNGLPGPPRGAGDPARRIAVTDQGSTTPAAAAGLEGKRGDGVGLKVAALTLSIRGLEMGEPPDDCPEELGAGCAAEKTGETLALVG
jgi:hypothetical protein